MRSTTLRVRRPSEEGEGHPARGQDLVGPEASVDRARPVVGVHHIGEVASSSQKRSAKAACPRSNASSQRFEKRLPIQRALSQSASTSTGFPIRGVMIRSTADRAIDLKG